MNRALFLKLIKKWHPDTTRNPKMKVLCGEVSRHILRANEEGDFEALKEIDRLGEGYLEVIKQRQQHEEREIEAERRRQAAADEAYRTTRAERAYRQQWFYAYPVRPPRRNSFVVLLELINPYLLLHAMKSWAMNGRLYNAWALCSGLLWLWVWWLGWKEIGSLEAATQAAGYAREGGVGLVFVLSRGVFIIAGLPIAFCAGAVLVYIAVLAGACLIVAWFCGIILGLFHPWLVHLPYVLAAVFVLIVVWQSLEEPFLD